MGAHHHNPDPELLIAALDSEPVAVALFEPLEGSADYRYIYTNPAFAKLKPGVPMRGRTLREVWPEIGTAALDPIHRVLATGEPWSAVDAPFSVERRAGVTEQRHYTFEVSRIESRGRPYLLQVAEDTTEQVEARQSSAMLAEVVTHMSDSFVVWDRDWRYVFVNDKAVENLGKGTREDILGKRLWDLFPEIVGTIYEREYRRAMMERVPVTFEAHYEPYDVWNEVRAYPTPEGIAVFYAHDITDRKRAEAEREQLVSQLEESLAQLRDRDRAIRKAYSDVIDVVTGGKLVLLLPEDIEQSLGEAVSSERVVEGGEIAATVIWLEQELERRFPTMPEITAFRDACAEALTNAVKHAGCGAYQLHEKASRVQFRVTDSGPGIDFAKLPRATLQTGYSSVGTLGIGFSTMLHNCDRVLLSTQPGGTTLVLEADSTAPTSPTSQARP